MIQNLPLELMHLIWDFAYNYRLGWEPSRDLDIVSDIQESIPACFITDRLPTKMGQPQNFHSQPFWQVYPPNPFKKGNPYLPSTSIYQGTLWSALPGTLFQYLTKQGVRSLRTYKRVLLRRYNSHIQRNIFEWNQSFNVIFGNVELCNVENYDLKDCPFAWQFENILLKQLSQSKFLSF